MSRLTIECNGDYVPKAACTINRFGEADDCKMCEEICNEADDCKTCYLQACMNKLAEYEDAEEQGLLLRLPCKIRSVVYALAPFCEICEAPFNDEYACINCTNETADFITETKFDYEMIPMFGKTIFLTKEEAKAAVKAMKEGE